MRSLSQKEYTIRLILEQRSSERVEKLKEIPNFEELSSLITKNFSKEVSESVILSYKDEGDLVTMCNEEEWETYLALLKEENPDFNEICILLEELDSTIGTWDDTEISTSEGSSQKLKNSPNCKVEIFNFEIRNSPVEEVCGPSVCEKCKGDFESSRATLKISGNMELSKAQIQSIIEILNQSGEKTTSESQENRETTITITQTQTDKKETQTQNQSNGPQRQFQTQSQSLVNGVQTQTQTQTIENIPVFVNPNDILRTVADTVAGTFGEKAGFIPYISDSNFPGGKRVVVVKAGREVNDF